MATSFRRGRASMASDTRLIMDFESNNQVVIVFFILNNNHNSHRHCHHVFFDDTAPTIIIAIFNYRPKYSERIFCLISNMIQASRFFTRTLFYLVSHVKRTFNLPLILRHYRYHHYFHTRTSLKTNPSQGVIYLCFLFPQKKTTAIASLSLYIHACFMVTFNSF